MAIICQTNIWPFIGPIKMFINCLKKLLISQVIVEFGIVYEKKYKKQNEKKLSLMWMVMHWMNVLNEIGVDFFILLNCFKFSITTTRFCWCNKYILKKSNFRGWKILDAILKLMIAIFSFWNCCHDDQPCPFVNFCKVTR